MRELSQIPPTCVRDPADRSWASFIRGVMLAGMRTSEHPWRNIIVVCFGLALVSLVFNIALPTELMGGLQVWSFIRKTITKIVSSGTAWAAIAVYAGWKLASPARAYLGGITAAVVTLTIHYLLGVAAHLYPITEITRNAIWYLAAIVLCGPLGLIGWLAASPTRWGLIARLIVPAGAIAEPLVTGAVLRYRSIEPWPESYSSTASGILLILLGAAAASYLIYRGPTWTGRKQRPRFPQGTRPARRP